MTKERFNPEGYNIDANLAALYARAYWMREGDDKEELVTEMLETMSTTRSMDATGIYPETDTDGRPHRRAGEAKGLADRIVQIENETDFRLIQIVNHSSSMGTAFFRRIVLIGLSIPDKLLPPEENETEIENTLTPIAE